MVQCRLRELMAIKSREEGQRVTYHQITQATGIFNSTLTRLANNKFDRVDRSVLDRLCVFFSCQPGDLLIYVPGPERSTAQGLQQ